MFKKLLDIGDIIALKGLHLSHKLVNTQFMPRVKSSLQIIKVLPIVKKKRGRYMTQFSDPELRYRMRYVDLIVNPA